MVSGEDTIAPQVSLAMQLAEMATNEKYKPSNRVVAEK